MRPEKELGGYREQIFSCAQLLLVRPPTARVNLGEKPAKYRICKKIGP